jgi:hypothetical protein
MPALLSKYRVARSVRAVVRDQRLFNVRQAFFQGRICKQFVPQADKSADNVHAHGDGSWTVEDGGGHNRAVLGESSGQSSPSAPPL